jgi:hypothetical protein
MLTLSAHASIKGVLPNLMAHVGILLAVVVLSESVLLSYSYAPKITTRISAQTAHGIRLPNALHSVCLIWRIGHRQQLNSRILIRRTYQLRIINLRLSTTTAKNMILDFPGMS